MSSRLLLGDWGRVIRDPIDLLRLAFLVAAIGYSLGGDVSSGLRLLLAFGFLVLARLANLPRPFELGLVFVLAVESIGYAERLFRKLAIYDEIVHSLVLLAVAPLLYILLSRVDTVPDLAERGGPPRRWYIGLVTITAALGVVAGVIYEVYEYVVNKYLGANLVIGYGDTIADLCLNAGASVLGGFALLAWAERGWGTTRRVPGREASGKLERRSGEGTAGAG